MNYGHLAETSNKTKTLILGALGLGGFISKSDSYSLLDTALELGIHDIDCGVSYGNGNARATIAQYQKSRGVTFRIWEKIGLEMSDGGGRLIDLGDLRVLNETFASIFEDYNQDAIYSLQIHTPPNVTDFPILCDFLAKNKALQKFDFLGISNHETPEMQRIMTELDSVGLHLDSNQVHLNIAEQRALKDILKFSESRGVGVIANRIFARGILAHKDIGLGKRKYLSAKLERQFESSHNYYLNLINYCEKFAEKPIRTIALNWILSLPAISGVVCGASSAEQLRETVEAYSDENLRQSMGSLQSELEYQFGESLNTLPLSMFDMNY